MLCSIVPAPASRLMHLLHSTLHRQYIQAYRHHVSIARQETATSVRATLQSRILVSCSEFSHKVTKRQRFKQSLFTSLITANLTSTYSFCQLSIRRSRTLRRSHDSYEIMGCEILWTLICHPESNLLLIFV